MNRKKEEKAEARFAAYVAGLSGVLGHADRIGPLRDYCTGLILPGERKSVEPMAAKTAAFCRCRVLVGREGAGQGTRDGAACNGTAGADRGVDHR
jgi:SRSO17 transposase